MRSTPQKDRDSEEEKFEEDVRNSLSRLQDRLSNFEKEVRDSLFSLNDRVSRLEIDTSGSWLPPHPASVKRGMGRKPKIEPDEVLKRRDQLVVWIERAWPFLSIALRKAKRPQDAVAAMMEAKARVPFVMPIPPFEMNPQEHEAALWEFLKSKRLYGNPRNLAAAMAGLPELSWKRSFDICSKHPCEYVIAEEAWGDYLRRKFPDRLRELRRAKTEEDVRSVLRRSRGHDPTYLFLKKHPDAVLKWLDATKNSGD